MSGLPLLSGASAAREAARLDQVEAMAGEAGVGRALERGQRAASARTVSITSMSRSIGWLKVIWLMRARDLAGAGRHALLRAG